MKVLARARVVNFGLLLLAVASLCVTFWTARLPTTSELQVRQRHLLPVFRQDAVERLEIRQGQRRTVLSRRAPLPGRTAEGETEPAALPPEPVDAEWALVEPFETDADPAPVEQLLGSLQYATWEREMPWQFTLETESGAIGAVLSGRELGVVMGELSYRLRLGQDAVSPPGSRYVEVKTGSGEGQVYVIKKRLVDSLFVDAEGFRGRQIVPYRKGSVDRLILSSAAGVRRLRRVGGDFHFEDMEDGQRAARTAVDRIFMALSRAVAEPLLDVELAKAALSADTSIRVSLLPAGSDKSEASLEFGGACPATPDKTIALRHLPEPLAGCVDHSVLWALREPASSLIDRGLFGFSADEVDTVRIEEGEQVLEFARSGDGFVLHQPRSMELDTEAVQDRLSRILVTEAELLTGKDKPAPGAAFEGAVVTLESSSRPGEERVKESVRVSAPLANGTRRILREVDGAVLVVSAKDAAVLRADATLLKEHQVFDYAIRDVRSVEVTRGSVKQTLKRSVDGVLTLAEPKGMDVDGGLAVALIDQLRTLRALRWVSDREVTGFGLDKPRALVRLQVEVDGREVERTLELGSSAPGGYYASVDRDPGVFVAPRAIDRVLGTWLLDRSVFSAHRDSVAELTLNAEGRGKVLLKRVAGELTLQKGSSNFDASRIDELLDAIEALRPEAAVHLGASPPAEGLRRPILSGIIKRQSPENVGTPPIRFSIGNRDSFQDASIYYARHGSVNATYALPRQQVQRLLDLF